MKILFCTDGSLTSFNAIKNYSQWFNNFEVDVLSISDLTYFYDNIVFNNNKLVEQCSNNVQNILNTSKNFLEESGIKLHELIKKCGSATDVILEEEYSGNYEYVVMGSNGKKGIQKWLGSVSQDVASKSKTRVFISKNEQKSKSILFTIQPSNTDFSGFKENLSKMNLIGAQITLISVYEMPDFLFLEGNVDSNWVTDVELKQRKEAIWAINSAEKLFIDSGLTVSDKVVLKGSPSQEILQFMENNRFSLVVTGMSKKKNYNYNSVSRRILEYSNCDVLIDKNI